MPRRARGPTRRRYRCEPSSWHIIAGKGTNCRDCCFRQVGQDGSSVPPRNAGFAGRLGSHRMNYVRRVLQPGEAVIYETRIHPVIFLPAIVWLVLAIVLFIAALTLTGDLRIGGEALAVFCLVFAAGSFLP